MMQRFQKWILCLVAIGTVIGSLLGQKLNYIINGTFYLDAILGTVISAIILIFINIIMVYVKSDKTPYTDERTKNHILKLLAYSSQLFLVLVFVTFGILGLIGVENILLTYLLIGLMVYFLIIGIGAFVLRNR